MQLNKRKVFQIILGVGMVGSVLVLFAPVRSAIIAFNETFIVHRELAHEIWHPRLLKVSYACFAICVFFRFFHRSILTTGMIGSLLLSLAPVRSAIITFGDQFIVHGWLNHEAWHSRLLKLSYACFAVCVFFKFFYPPVKVRMFPVIRKLCPEKTGIFDSILNGMAFSGVFVLLSFIAVAAKSSEFDASKTDVFIAFLLFGMVVAAVFVVIGLVCRIIGTKKNLRILSSFNKFCTALVLLFLIITVFWPETYGLFDGNGWEIDYSLLAVIKALLPYCTALVLAVCVVLFFKKQFRHISPVLCVLTCVIFVLSPVTADGKVGSSEINSRLLSKSQNIIFIIWDGLPGIIADYIFEQNPPLKEDFRDFVFYPRAVTPYAQTYIAVPSIVGGIPASQEFDTEDNSALLKIFEETTILKKAEMAGYNLEPKQMGWYLGTPQTLQEIFLVRMASILYKCSTRVLPPHILNFGYEIKMRLSYPWKFQQARTVSILMEDIGIGYEQPVFYNLHCMVPHGPWLFTPDGKFTESGTILSDSEFSMNLMSMMLKRLKALGIYDNSLIVFWSDHGNQMQMRPMEGDSNLIRKYNEFVKWLPEYFSYQGNSRSDVGAHNPFLLIKYPYLQQENILIRNNPVATFYLYQFLEQALNTPDWESGTLTGVFDKIDGPIEVRLMHKEDYKDVWENHDNFNLMQTFELENGLESLPEIFNNLRPISEIK